MPTAGHSRPHALRSIPPRMIFLLAPLAVLFANCRGDQDAPPRGPIAPSVEPQPAGDLLPLDDPARIGTPDLARLRSEPAPVTVIDVRPEAAFDAFHIPGALRLSPHELRASGTVRAGVTVIVEAGHGVGRVTSDVRSLREAGRDVRLLDGGMQAWCRAGGTVTAPCRGEDLMTPAELYAAAECTDRAVIVAIAAGDPRRTEREQQAARLLPGARVVPFSTPDELAVRVREGVLDSSVRTVLVVDPSGQSYAEVRSGLRSGVPAHLFFVEGGLDAYAAYLGLQQAQRSARTVVSQGRRTGSSDPPSASGVVRAPKGCGCQ